VVSGRTDLVGHRVISASGSLADIAACRWFSALGGEATFSASSPAAQQEAAAAGGGIALLPEVVASADSRLVRIDFPGPPESDVWIVARRPVAAQPRVAAFLKWFRRRFVQDRKRAETATSIFHNAPVAVER
jgi:DNA-binding transcriptional LysR family regulator